MSTHIISATEASRTLSTILNKVHYQGESYEIKRGREIIARIIPAAPSNKSELKINALNDLFKQLPHLDKNDNTFENDTQSIRHNMKIEDQSWD